MRERKKEREKSTVFKLFKFALCKCCINTPYASFIGHRFPPEGKSKEIEIKIKTDGLIPHFLSFPAASNDLYLSVFNLPPKNALRRFRRLKIINFIKLTFIS